MASDRDLFLARVYSMPLLTADAIVVLAREDGIERANVGLECFRQQLAPVIVCAGGVSDPPRRVSGQDLAVHLLTRGLAPDRVLVEGGSTNTHEQAEHVIDLAVANDWHRLLLVASNYHLPRAFLTFVRTIGPRGIRLSGMSTTHLPWGKCPPGMNLTRNLLLTFEMDKCRQYTEHVATWREGVDYLNQWEGK